ncbi:MAG: hypothetical protein QG622_2884 [Actinomycetota bacterium]|nr:hypothetical protein [Actinomycetota bacterium]
MTVTAPLIGCGPVAEVYAREAGGSWACGSGYHLGSGLVLTSRHVVTDTTGARRGVQVRLLGDDAFQDGTVEWTGTGDVDAALVRVTAPGWTLPPVRPVRWGRLVTSQPGIPCTGQGFPRVQATPERVRDVEHLAGTINPLTTVKAHRLSIAVSSPPASVTASGTPWAGMSGSAVLCGGLLVAVVAQDPAGFASTRLTAVPVTELMEDPQFRRLVAKATRTPVRVRPVEVDTLFARPEPFYSPAQLLRADAQIVPFRGRLPELEALERWCADKSRFSGRVLVGQGGQGKSRLAFHLADKLTAQGWIAGLLTGTPTPEHLATLAQVRAPLLLAVDYAETRAELLATLTTTVRDAAVPVRVLLIARAATDWITTAAADHPPLAWLPTTPVINLPALEPTPIGRLEAWHEALTTLSPRLAELPDLTGHDWPRLTETVSTSPSAGLDDDTTEASRSSILGIHMDALARLLTAAVPESAARQAADVLLVHEQRYWRRTATARGLVLADSTAAIVTAMVALYGASDTGEAEQLLAVIPSIRDLSEDRQAAVDAWLATLYPAAGHHWGSLQPDRLAEHHLATQLARHPALITTTAGAASPRQAEQALTVFTRAAPQHPHLATAIEQALTTSPRVFGPAGMTVAIQAADPAPLQAALSTLATEIADTPSADDDTLVTAARLLGKLANAIPHQTERLRELAVHITHLTVTLYRRLAESHPDTYLPDLASSLNNLSNRLGDLGRREEGLAAVQEAVTLRRRLAEAHPDAYLPDLAMSLNNLSVRLGDLGRREEGLAAVQEAVTLRRRLAEAHPDAYLPDLASSLNNLSLRLGDLGRREEGLAAIQEAVTLRRRLAEAHPDAYLPDLQRSLKVLKLLQGLGEQNEESPEADG